METLNHTVAYGQGMARLTPQDWIRAAATELARGGVESVRVEPLAKDLGVSKGSFYWHFPDRDALLDAVLEGWRKRGTQAVIAAVEAASSTPQDRLRALMDEAHTTRGHEGFEVAVRAWAATDERARAAVVDVDRARVGYVTELLEAAGFPLADARRRAELLYRALLGEYLMRHYGTAPHDSAPADAVAIIALQE